MEIAYNFSNILMMIVCMAFLIVMIWQTVNRESMVRLITKLTLSATLCVLNIIRLLLAMMLNISWGMIAFCIFIWAINVILDLFSLDIMLKKRKH